MTPADGYNCNRYDDQAGEFSEMSLELRTSLKMEDGETASYKKLSRYNSAYPHL